MAPALLDELIDWLRIPSVSTGGGDAAAIDAAASWVIERVIAAGGTGDLVRIGDGNPLAVGNLSANANGAAPTILIYGHYDVQGPGALELWTTPPFDPQIRDGRLYARGAADDKGNFLPLLYVACELARDGALPVNIRVLVEGEEEVNGDAVAEWVRADERPPDAAIVYDGGIPDADTPAITVGLRGVVMLHLEVRTAPRNIHSGMYGGSVLNALHVMQTILAEVLPGPDGRLREELRVGIREPSQAELDSWQRLPSGASQIAAVGGHPVHAGAGEEYYRRNGADSSLDMNEISGGEPRTIVPPVAKATISMRLAPGQDPDAMYETLVRLLRAKLPDGAELSVSSHRAPPALFEPEQPALQLAAQALASATGRETAFIRTGGSVPIVAEMAKRGYPVIVGGFGLPEDSIHAPDESYALHSLEWGEASALELYRALAALPGRS